MKRVNEATALGRVLDNDDLLRRILGSLSNENGRIPHASVCKKWKEELYSLQSTLQVPAELREDKVEKFVGRFPNLRSLSLRTLYHSQQRFFLVGDQALRLPLLEHLHICGKSKGELLGPTAWDMFFCSRTSLVSLHLVFFDNIPAPLLKLPDSISKLVCLRSLRLRRDVGNFDLPHTLSALTALEHLDISTRYDHLPSFVGSLTRLTHFGMFVRQEEEEEEEFGNMLLNLNRLVSLRLSVSRSISQRLLLSIHPHLSRLLHLEIQSIDLEVNTGDWDSFFLAAQQLKSLALDVPEADSFILPDSLSCLHHLEVLRLSDVQHLPQTVSSLSCLKDLHVSSATFLPSSLSVLSALTHLEAVITDSCPMPLELVSISSLRRLDLKLETTRHISNKLLQHENLRALFLSSLDSQCLPVNLGARLQSLRRLSIVNCPDVLSIPDSILCLVNLKYLLLQDLPCKRLPSCWSGLSVLHTLIIDGCDNLVQLPASIGQVSSLERLAMVSCHEVEDLPDELGGLVHLQLLDLHDNYSLKSVPHSVGLLPNLKRADFSSCPLLTDIPQPLQLLCQNNGSREGCMFYFWRPMDEDYVHCETETCFSDYVNPWHETRHYFVRGR